MDKPVENSSDRHAVNRNEIPTLMEISMSVAFEDAKARMNDALANKPSAKDDWAKLIRAAEDILRSAGVRQ